MSPFSSRTTSLIRRLLLCLLVLALPAQGIAAATMRFCGPADASVAMAAGDGPHAGHDMAGHHAASVVLDQTDHAQQDPAAPGQPNQADGAQKGCSACAVCCAAFALQASPLQLPLADPLGTVRSTLPAYAPVFLTGGLDRPPRPSHT